MLWKVVYKNNDKSFNKPYLFPTQFYEILTGKGRDQYNYELVKKWTKLVDIFEKNIVFIPICINEHWVLICIVGLGLESGLPYVLYLDSLSGKSKTCDTIFTNILQ